MAVTRNETLRAQAEKLSRWEANLFQLSADLASSARSLIHYAGRNGRRLGPDERTIRLDNDLRQIRSLSEQVKLVGSVRVQTAARMVRRYAFELRRLSDRMTDESPQDLIDRYRAEKARLNNALLEFYASVRTQLGYPEPSAVITDDLGYELDPIRRVYAD